MNLPVLGITAGAAAGYLLGSLDVARGKVSARSYIALGTVAFTNCTPPVTAPAPPTLSGLPYHPVMGV